MYRFFGGLPAAISLLTAACLTTTAARADRATLSLAEAQQLAVERQPLLVMQTAQVSAAHDRAIAARQLPDPQLTFGVQNLPANTQDAWRFNRDSMTMSTIGLMQEVPLPGKRRLRGEAEALKAAAGDAQIAATTRAIRRDAGLAYLDLLHPHHAGLLVQAQLREAQRALEATQIAYRSGTRGQSDVLAARAALGELRDRAAGFEQAEAVARENLARWIGESPDFEPQEPEFADPPSLAELLDQLSRHPELAAADRGIERADVAQRLARKSKEPDFNVELDYGYRQDYSEMVSLRVGVPLPVFARNRQDRDIAAAQADLDAEQGLREDLRRRLAAQMSGAYRDWQALGERIQRYEADVIPPLDQRIEASLIEYRSGGGAFAAVIDARQSLLDAQLALLELRLQRQRRALDLRYFMKESGHA